MIHQDSSDRSFLVRLNSENPLCSDSTLRVVPDADPIMPGHRLLYAIAPVASLADVDGERLSHFLSMPSFERSYSGWAIFERGRAPFCTSAQAACHAHAHLLPNASLTERARFDGLSFVERGSLERALELVPPDTEYVVYGRLGGTVRIALVDRKVPKRLIRSALTAALRPH